MEQTPATWWWLFPSISAVGGLIGGILGSFFSKRGEIAAIQSQIKTVVSQNDYIVKSSEEIKSDISQRDWSKQKRWEMQREIAIDVMRLFVTMLRTASRLWELTVQYDAVYAGKEDITKDPAKEFHEEWQAAREATFAVTTTYSQSEEMARLAFSDSVRSCMEAVKDKYKELTASIWAHNVKSMEKLGKGFEELRTKQEALAKAIRSEFGF